MENLPMIFEIGLFIVVFIMLAIAGIAISFRLRDRRAARGRVLLRLIRFVLRPEPSAIRYYRNCTLDVMLKYNPYAANYPKEINKCQVKEQS